MFCNILPRACCRSYTGFFQLSESNTNLRTAQLIAFKFMTQNLAQLSKNVELNEKILIDKCHKIIDFYSRVAAEKSDHTDLLLLNKQHHELVRARMYKEKAVNGFRQKQAFNLIIFLIYMMIVTDFLVF